MINAFHPLSIYGKRRKAFTLIEMLIATTLAAVLITADLAVLSRLGKDRQLIARQPARISVGLADLFDHDFQQADTVDDSRPAQLDFIGHGSIDQVLLQPDQRWARITYRLIQTPSGQSLWRTQQYLDDPARQMTWTERVSEDVTGWTFSGDGAMGHSSLAIETRTGHIMVERKR